MTIARPLLIAYDGSADARAAVEQTAKLFPGAQTIVLYARQPLEGLAAHLEGHPALEELLHADRFGGNRSGRRGGGRRSCHPRHAWARWYALGPAGEHFDQRVAPHRPPDSGDPFPRGRAGSARGTAAELIRSRSTRPDRRQHVSNSSSHSCRAAATDQPTDPLVLAAMRPRSGQEHAEGAHH